ncbi:hypothetical protein HYS79_01865 [Patescibacteria group bacterium]|nr:hypothetical protein [Patescibacteria group bacterium]
MASPSKQKGHPVAPVRCLWGHLCSLSSIDNERNNLSLFNIIEQLNIPQGAFDEHVKTKKIIIIPADYEIVLLWTRTLDIDGINDALSFDFSLKVIDPTNKVIQQTIATANFPRESKRVRFRIRSNGMPVTIPGSYRFDVEVKRDGKDEFENTNGIPLEIKPIVSKLPIG